ncbi:nuclease [Burkholderia sp. AU33423]|uniref:nuclease n=1 Tax=Burkholderia sp. AU33423 TaxID=2015355 RepID=UPI000B79D92A|nr:nuclease [Burkholderia sp. AU33423]OXI88546.1 nuclease [Burkholderia sp. AU33423]
MSGGYSGGSAVGGSATGNGQTTVVGARKGITQEDKAFLCRVMCDCGRIGVWTRGGGRLQRQKCVEQRVDADNDRSVEATGQKTVYVPEVNYNMIAKPPSPIMSNDDPLEPHGDLLDYIRNSWPGKMKGYLEGKRAGLDQTRRPDVVIVYDPSQPPEQSNIRAVIEMKFEDQLTRGQASDYIKIAGDEAKYVPLKKAQCGCPDEDAEKEPARSTQRSTSTDTEELFGGNAGGAHKTGPLGLPQLPPVGPGPAAPGIALPF